MRGSVRLLEFVGAVLDHGLHAEDRQVDRAGAVHRRAGPRDLLEQQRRLGDAEAVAAVLLGDGHAEPAALGDGVVELLREFVRLVLLHPVVVVELARQLGDGLADQLLVLGQLETHSARHAALLLIDRAQSDAPVRYAPLRTGALSQSSGLRQSLLPVSSLAFAAKSAKLAPVCLLLGQRLDGDVWPSAALRSAPTVACSRVMWVNGSSEYQRMAFS